METTLDISEQLLKKAELLASQSNRSLAAIVEDGLRLALEAKPVSYPLPRRIALPSLGSGGPLPGINLDNNAALLDLMDGFD